MATQAKIVGMEVEEPKKAGLKVRTAYLQAAVIIAGKTETTLSHERIPGIKMVLTPVGLMVKLGEGSHFKDQVIPSTNIKNMILE